MNGLIGCVNMSGSGIAKKRNPMISVIGFC